MKRIKEFMKTLRAVTVCVFVLCLTMLGQQQAPVQETLTDAKIIQMVQSHLSQDLIILSISKCNPSFALDSMSLQYMVQQGVSDDIIKAMAAKQVGRPIPGYTQAATTTPTAEAGYIPQRTPTTSAPPRPASKLSDGDLFVGFSYASADFNGLIPRQNMIGWEGSSAVAFKKWTNTKLSAEGVGSGFYDTQNSYWASLHDYSFAGGLRADTGPLFVHYLAGVSHLTASSSALAMSASQNALAMFIGGGFQVRIAGPLAFRASVDYILTRHNVFAPDYQHNFRVSTGVVICVGKGSHLKL